MSAARPGSAAELAYEASPLRRLALGVLCAKIAMVVLVFDPYALNAFSQPKALVAHASAYVLVGTLAALALHHGRAMFRWSPMHLPVAAFVAAYLLAAVFALDHRVALYGAPDRSLGLISALDSVLVYAAAVALVRTRADLLWLGATLAGTTVLLLGYAIVQKLGLDPIPWASGIVEARPFATTGNPGVLGQYMATVVAAAAALSVLTSRSAARLATVAAGLAVAALFGSLLAGARSSLFGLLAGGLVVAASFATRLTWRIRVFLATGSLVSIVVAAVIVFALLGLRGQALSSSAVGEALATAAAGGSVAGRLDIYRVAFEELRGRPVVGVGPDNYVVAFPRYRSPDSSHLHESDAPQSSTHSWFWKTATDAGVLGLAAFLAVALTGLVIGIRGMAASSLSGAISAAAVAALAAYLGTGLFSIDHVATAWIPWVALGTIVAAPHAGEMTAYGNAVVARGERSRRRRAPQRWTWRQVAGVGLVAASLFLAASPIRAVQASHAAQEARRAYGLGERGLRAMQVAGERAVALDPDRAEYWGIRGLAAFGAEDFNKAEDAFRRASAIAPYDITYLMSLARTQFNLGLRGDRQARTDAVATASRATALDPNVAASHYTLALVLLGAGRYSEAAEESERGAALAPEYPDKTVYQIAAQAYLQLDRPMDAERWIRKGQPTSAEEGHKAQVLLAEVLAAQGRTAEALEILNGILANDPTDQETIELLKKLTGD